MSENHGYSWHIAVIFTFGETAGSGLVALPRSMISLGFIGGLTTLVLMCLITFYTSHLLGNNWILMKKKWTEYNEHCRNPYPEMAEKAMGNGMGIFASICIHLTTFGGGAVFSLLASKTLSEVLTGYGVQVSNCSMLMVVGLVLWPFAMLKSPMHFWQVSIVAALSTLTAVFLILFGYFLDFSPCQTQAFYPTIDPMSASTSLATIIFAYGGHPCLPTIVHDMKNPQHFFRACLLSYIAFLLIYTPISLFGYSIYGDSVTDSVISSIQNDALRRAISILIAIHVFFSILIIVNPLLQASEQLFKLKQEFGIGRFLVRTIVFWTVIFSAASVPNFGVVINLVGGSTLPLLVLIFPIIFAICLECQEKMVASGVKEDFSWRMVLKFHPKWRLLADLMIIILGIWVMITSTYQSITSILFNDEFTSPSCFHQWFINAKNEESLASNWNSSASFQCCGAFRNVSIDLSKSCHHF